MTINDWIMQLVLPGLAVAAITGYIRLAFGSIHKEIGVVSKDVRKSTERIEQSIVELKTELVDHDKRLDALEIGQAERIARENALAEVVHLKKQ